MKRREWKRFCAAFLCGTMLFQSVPMELSAHESGAEILAVPETVEISEASESSETAENNAQRGILADDALMPEENAQDENSSDGAFMEADSAQGGIFSEDVLMPDDGAQAEIPSDDILMPGDEQDGADLFSIDVVEVVEDNTPQTQQVLSGECGEDGAPVSWKLENGVLTISGSGAIMDSYTIINDATGEITEQPVPWDEYRDLIETLIIEKGVTMINRNNFTNCYNLEKAVIAGSVKRIRYNAFANDENLKEVELGEGIEYLEEEVFCGCALTSLTLPSTIKEVGRKSIGSAISVLNSLQEIQVRPGGAFLSKDGVLFTDGGKTLAVYPKGRTGAYAVPAGTEKIAEDAFGYANLSGITFPDSVTEIEESAFMYCDKLTSLTFPPKLKVINYAVCRGAENLASVTIPNGVTEIKVGAFWGCPSLASVTLPPSVISVADAFDEKTKVTSQNPFLHQQEDGTFVNAVSVNVRAKQYYKQAFEVLKLVNQERAKVGSEPLVMDESLLKTAMLRASETALYWDHERPTGSGCSSANPLMMGENIAFGSSTAAGVMSQWMNSQGHKDNILSTRYRSIGVGCIYQGGTYYWVQCFGMEEGTPANASAYTDRTADCQVWVKKDPEYYKAEFSLSSSTIKIGQTATVDVKWDGVKLEHSGAMITSSDPSVCRVESDGKLKGVKAGTATISVYFEGYPEGGIQKKITVKKEESSSGKPGSGTDKPDGRTIKITYNANKGSVKTKSKQVSCGAKFGKLASPSRKGYAFGGWYTKKTGGTKITSKSKVSQKKDTTLYAHWKKVTVPGTSVRQLSNKKGRKMAVSIKKASGASGYQIVYAADRKLKKGKKTRLVTKTSATLSGLKKGRTYYVKVRAYKKDSAGKKVYGKYSAVKKVKIRK